MDKTASPENNVYRLLRIARDLRVKDVAEALDVTPAYISAIEAGKREPSTKLISEYARVLGVDANTLLYFRDPDHHPQKFESFLLTLLQKIVALDHEKA